MNNKITEIIEKTFVELDLFNATILTILIAKKVFTLEEFNESKEAIREPLRKETGKRKWISC